ncbi:MAG: phosphoribosyl 1,2-cyclic phosphodiesterase [Myxococcota bacterium]|jgi:phosphoribosyl 1,2-cyclic phosphodiesterase
MQIDFWGVRGSIPVSGEMYRETGGSTSCVEVRTSGQHLIFDAGTGLRALGARLGCQPLDLTILFSHVHWDHIQGFPFFLPAFHPGSHLTLIGPPELPDALSAQMQPPTFPLTLQQIPAQLSFRTLSPGEVIELGPVQISAARLAHPDAVLALRVEADGRSVVYATDHEHGRHIDEGLVRFAEGTDLLIHDAQYTEAEYNGEDGPSRRGWGHSCWDEAVAVAEQAGARHLALFHHDPSRDDRGVSQIEQHAAARFPAAFAAREGRGLALG